MATPNLMDLGMLSRATYTKEKERRKQREKKKKGPTNAPLCREFNF